MIDRRGLTEPLNEREQEILACLVEGLTNREISSRLHIAYRTVKWYNTQIYSKLGVNNRDDAIQRASELGLFHHVSTPSQQQGNHNLPAQVTPFVGRQQEIHDLKKLIASDRLVTVLAPGGMGKTRLSLAVARGQIGHYRDGVYFVPLAPLSSPADIVTTIAENIGFVFHGEQAPDQQLVSFLKHRTLFLILDNFEHLLDGAGLVSEIIQSASDVKILVTSRERLNLHGETVYNLRGMEFPTWETTEDAMDFDSVKLFMQSAKRVRSGFEFHADELDFLARICRLTAGMPLGIELAAGWVDVLSLEKIADEIQRGIDILETDMRDMPERHRSLRATFEQTWHRRTEDEQTVFARLSVFRGGFTLESAEAVAGANARHLRKLAQKSLVQTESNRYAIHELLRQFGESKLSGNGEYETVQAQHARYFAELIAPFGDSPWSSGTQEETEIVQSIKALRMDFDNMRAAWFYYADTGDIDSLRFMMDGLWRFVDEHSRSSDGVSLFRYTHSLFLNESNDDSELFKLQLQARENWYQLDMGNYTLGVNRSQNLLPILKGSSGSSNDVLLVYATLQIGLWFLGRMLEVQEIASETTKYAHEVNSKKWLRFLQVTSFFLIELEQFEQVIQSIEVEKNQPYNEYFLGIAWYELGQLEKAEPYLLEAIENKTNQLHTGIPNFYRHIITLAVLVELHTILKNYPEAKQQLLILLNKVDNETYRWITFLVLEHSLVYWSAVGRYDLAVEILACIMDTIDDEGGLAKFRAKKHRTELESSVSYEVFKSAWERGSQYHLDELVGKLLSELEEAKKSDASE